MNSQGGFVPQFINNSPSSRAENNPSPRSDSSFQVRSSAIDFEFSFSLYSLQPGRHQHRQLAAQRSTHAGRHHQTAGRPVSQMTGHRARRTLVTLQMMMILTWIKRFLIKLPPCVLKPTKSSAQCYHPLFAALNTTTTTTTTTILMYILSAEPSPPIFLLHSFFLNYQAKPETRLFYTLTTSELTIDVHENQLQFIYVNTTFIFVSFNFTRKVLKRLFRTILYRCFLLVDLLQPRSKNWCFETM